MKQQTTVPTYYKDVQRCNIATIEWNLPSIGYNPMNYTANCVYYHSILNECEDPEYREFNAKTGTMVFTKPQGWADPENLNAFIPVKGKRMVGMSTIQEFDLCKSILGECSDLSKLEQIEKLSSVCVPLGIKLRYSHCSPIVFGTDYPLNPKGRTGLEGRGTLGNWGPNHAADPVVCRANPETGILEFVLIYRAGDRCWALPGGFVEAGQTIASARTREFAEEALAGDRYDDETDEEYRERIDNLQEKYKHLFEKPNPYNVLYAGISDDPRNTDHAWIETMAILTVFEPPFSQIELNAGDDAAKVSWVEYNPDMNLFASHNLFIFLAVERLFSTGLIEFVDGKHRFIK